MYHSVVGKRLVEHLNRRDGTSYTVKGFFEEIYAPLFFGSSRMLQYVNNSPYAQTFNVQKKPFSQELLAKCTARLHEKIESQYPDASFYLGGAASGFIETTSGQVTSLRLSISPEEVYGSWIGAGLGLTIDGGLTLLIDNKDVLLATYDGWMRYRELLDQTPKLEPLQVNTWNGQWIAAAFDDSFSTADGMFIPQPDKDGKRLITQKWVQLLFSLASHFRTSGVETPAAYVYSLGKSNTTVGFVKLNLKGISDMVDLYQRLFASPSGMPAKNFERLYGTAHGFLEACAQTEIGVRALRPKDVFKALSEVPKLPKENETEKRVAFDTYQTWIIAMLNNKDLLTKADDLARVLANFSRSGTRLKTENEELVNELLAKKNIREIIEGITDILNKDASNSEMFEGIVSDLLALPSENVPLFMIFVRFRYSIAKSKTIGASK